MSTFPQCKGCILNSAYYTTMSSDQMFEIFVSFGQCLCCLLPPYVNRQLPSSHTNSLHGLLLPPMNYKNLWCGKGLALEVQSGCRSLGTGLAARQKSPVQPVRSNLHAPTRNTRSLEHCSILCIVQFAALCSKM